MIATSRGLVIIVVFIILFALILYLPFDSRHPDYRLLCKSNLKHMSMAALLYAHDHDDVWARNVNQLLPYVGTPKTLVCPATQHEPGEVEYAAEWTDYVFIADVNMNADSPEILAYCPPANHDGKLGIVVFSDGHVERLKTEEFGARLIEEGLSYAPKLP